MNPLSLYALLAIAGCFVQQSASAQLQARFSANGAAGCAPLVVQFNDQSAGNPNSWQWDLGNGTISLFQHPSTVYFLPGTYPVKLVIKNADGADSIIKQDFITVYANPVADFMANDSVGCFPFKMSLTDKSIAPGATINKWEWDFGDGNTSTQQHPHHTYFNSGNYTVVLKITTDKGCTQTFSKDQYIKIASGVKTQFSDSSDRNCKAPSTSFFTSSSTGPGLLGYSWNFGDGATSTTPNPSHTYNANGTYTVSLVTTSNAGCSDTVRKTIKLGTTITQFAVPDSICYGEIIPVTNSSSPLPASALWNFGDGATSTALNPQKAYFTLGTFNIRLVNTYEKCIDSITKPVKVFSKPTASFTSDAQTFCGIPATVKFSAGNTGIAYRWQFGDGATASTRDAVHTYNAFGNYTVKLFVTGAGGCIDSVVKKNYINIRRTQVQVPGLPARGCLGLPVPFLAKPEPGANITNLRWDFGDGSSSTETAPTKIYDVEGTYTVKLFFITESGCQDSLIMGDAVRVSKKPLVSFGASPTEACGSNKIWFENTSSPAGATLLWELGDGGTSAQQAFAYQYRDTGYFDVKLTVWNKECADTLVKKRYVHIEPPIARFRIIRSCNDKYLLGLENYSIGAKTWRWEFGDGTTSTEYSPSHRFAARGSYTVKLKVWNGSCVDSAVGSVVIADEKLAISANATDICKDSYLQFRALNYDAQYISTIGWDYGDGQTENQKTFVAHKYSKPGNYKVVLHYTDVNGCNYTTAIDQPVHVFGPTASFTVQQQTICIGASALFVDKSISDGNHPIIEWKWNYGDGTTDAQASSPFTHNYGDTGKYHVTLTVKDSYGCVNSIQKTSAIIISKPAVDFASPDTASCPGKPVSFNNYSSGSSLKYNWDFGDGNASNQQSPAHAYNAEGIFTVSLRVEDIYGCTGSLTKQRYINISIPAAAFTVSDSVSSCPPLQAQFTSQAKNYATLKWDFGDGSGSVLQNPEHFYNMPGVYYVKQIIAGAGGCTDTAVKKMVVKGPQGVFSYAPLAGCKPLTVQMKATNTTGNVSFVWDFNDGTVLPGNNPNVLHTYTNAGSFIPKLILIDSTGCRVPIEGKDTLKVVGVTARAAMNEYRVCNEGFIQFTDRSVANDYITGHHWDFGDGITSTEANPRHNYKGTGTYTVKHIAITSLGCRDTTTLPDTVRVWPKPGVTILGENAACEPAKLGFRPHVLAGDSAQFTWQWNFGNGATAQQAVADSQFYKSAGSYTVQLQVAFNNYCRDTAVHTVNIRPLPVVFAGNDTFVCRDRPVLLRAGGADRYIWSAVPGLSCTDCATTMINPADNISYIVTGFSAYGCSAKDTINVRVRQPFTISVPPGDTLCLGESLSLKAAGADLYEWLPAAGLNNAYIANPKATPAKSTTYTVYGKDSDHCFTDSAKVPVTVFPVPTVFAGNDTTVNTGSTLQLHTSSSADVNKWKWSPVNGLNCGDCPAPTAAIRNTITYRVDVSNAGGCKSFDEITVTSVCNGGNYFLPNTFSPNGDGANDIFYVRGKGVNRIQSLRIFNRWGQMVFEKRDFMPNDAGAGWDGTFKGKRADMDVYIYIAEVICENSAIVALKGDVTLIQ